MPSNIFPPGARVYVDGRDEAHVAQAFPEGSSSFTYPHYKVHFVGGDRNVAVSWKRVGVDRRAECKRCHQRVPVLTDGKLVTHSTPSGERTCNCIEPAQGG